MFLFLHIIDAFLVTEQSQMINVGCHLNNVVFVPYQLIWIADFECYLVLGITDMYGKALS